MPACERVARSSCPDWLWAILPLLLPALLTLPLLGSTVFGADESATMIGAGARHIGPYSPTEAVAAFVARWPDHAWGHVVTYTLWGRIVGWSEFAIRALPWLVGSLTLAWVYRIGRDLYSQRVALSATLLLATSSLFLTYMHVARPYGFALLLAVISLWAYWRVALHPRPPGHSARAALVLGTSGLLYVHYFCALLLPALALFHLIFVRKVRRWWQAVWIFGLAALLALPQVPDLLDGIAHNRAMEHLHRDALDVPEVILLFLHHFSNGLLNLWPQSGVLLALALPLPLFIAGRRSRQGQAPGPLGFMALTTILLALLLLGANEGMQVLVSNRVRYLAALWPPGALLLAGIAWRWPRSGLPVLALLIALAGLHFHLSESLRTEGDWRRAPAFLTAARAVVAENDGESLLVGGKNTLRNKRIWELYTGEFGARRVVLQTDASPADAAAHAQGYSRVLLFHDPYVELPVGKLGELLHQQGWFPCQTTTWEENLRLDRLHAPWPAGATQRERLQFGDLATLLVTEEPLLQDGLLRLRVHLRGEGEQIPSNYSLAVHVIDPVSGGRLTQGDVGIGRHALANRPGAVVPLCSEIDPGALPAGEYELRVGLYNWQTGELLPGRDVETGASGDMHTLQRFRVG